METALRTIMDSPMLPSIFKEIEFKLNEEALKRSQFLNEISENDKAEFINGEVIYHSPARLEHLSASRLLSQLIGIFISKYKLGYLGVEKMMISLTRNDYEPDICFFSNKKKKQFIKNQMRFTAPDLIVEILSKSTVKIDRGTKFEDYAAHGVMEYWIVDPDTEIHEQYFLNNGIYELNFKSGNGDVTSRAIEGFEIPVRAIFDEEVNWKVAQSIFNN